MRKLIEYIYIYIYTNATREGVLFTRTSNKRKWGERYLVISSLGDANV